MIKWFRNLVLKIGIDKISHFSISALLVIIIGNWLHFAISFALVMLLGLIKEFLDLRDTKKFDKKDLLADFIGSVFGTIFLLL